MHTYDDYFIKLSKDTLDRKPVFTRPKLRTQTRSRPSTRGPSTRARPSTQRNRYEIMRQPSTRGPSTRARPSTQRNRYEIMRQPTTRPNPVTDTERRNNRVVNAMRNRQTNNRLNSLADTLRSRQQDSNALERMRDEGADERLDAIRDMTNTRRSRQIGRLGGWRESAPQPAPQQPTVTPQQAPQQPTVTPQQAPQQPTVTPQQAREDWWNDTDALYGGGTPQQAPPPSQPLDPNQGDGSIHPSLLTQRTTPHRRTNPHDYR